MKLRIVRVGNSHGVRLPKALLDEAQLGANAELEATVTPDGILLAPARRVREGWAEACARMHAAGDDVLIETPLTESQLKEWTW